jgi:hypothetical protein
MGCTALHSILAEVVPQAVCRIPKVTYNKNGMCGNVSNLVLQCNLNAIIKAWTYARWTGNSSLKYCPIENHLSVSPILNVNTSDLVVGQVNYGLNRTKLREENFYLPETRWSSHEPRPIEKHPLELNFYGRPDPLYFTGHSIFTKQLEAEIEAYNRMLMNIALRVEVGHGALLTLTGLDYQDEPLVQKVKEDLTESWQKSTLMLAPVGSTLESYANSLTDSDKVTKPLQEAISAESKVPYYLLFPTETDSQFKLEEMENWASTLFNQIVLVPLAKLLYAQCYDVIDIEPPNYRSTKHLAEINNLKQDTLYKESATIRGLEQARTLKLKNDIGPVEFLEKSEKVKARYQTTSTANNTQSEDSFSTGEEEEDGTGGGQGRIL